MPVCKPEEIQRGNSKDLRGSFRLAFAHSPGFFLRQFRQAEFSGRQECNRHPVSSTRVQANCPSAPNGFVVGVRSKDQNVHLETPFFRRSKTTRQSSSWVQRDWLRRYWCMPE